jgi:hypothetical protein
MTNREQLHLDPRAIDWLRDGPDVAPSELLERALSRSRRAGQRPYLLAVALGAPDWRAASRPVPYLARWVLVAGLLVVAIVAVILASGRPRPDLLVTVPSGPLPTVDAERTIGPLPTRTVFDTGLGVSVASNPIEPWTEIGDGWFGFDLPGTLDFAYGACPDRTCPGGVVSISVATPGAGAIVDIEPGGQPTCPPEVQRDFFGCSTWQAINDAEGGGSFSPSPTTISGRSMDELLAAWKASFGADPELRLVNGVQWAIAEHGSRLTALVMDGEWIVSVTAQPTGGGDAAGRTQELRLQLFLAGLEFANSPEPWPTPDTRPVTTDWLDLELTSPGWNVQPDGDRLFVQWDSYGGLFGRQGFDIERARLGTSFVVDLGARTGGSGNMTAEVGGATFEDLVASIEQEIVAGSTPVESSLHGHRLWWWATPQRSYVGPLAWIAVLDAGDHVYLFQEHYPLDALFQRDHVEMLLDNLRWIGK